ncbi:MAG TPA: methylated-DNA--[protein]-cysteine S-methyltransferase [Rhodocyclaceae bacterium]|nr:methylated-DNA--[protein]-cysteine S-methyltransferase [Rhodocyclaceae bacterium]
MGSQLFSLERLDTPMGKMLIVTDEQDRLRAIDWEDKAQRMHKLLHEHYGKDAVELRETSRLSVATRALRDYFAGDMNAIADLPTATNGTAFQRAVWAALRRIPAGRTQSYGELAKQLSLPTAARAVGFANGSNPIAIVVPCHRVIGANGSLTGFAGGLERKRWLLTHEGAQCVSRGESQLEISL